MKKNLLEMLFFAIVILAGCTNNDQGNKCTDCNVILISIDTLRSDHLGCYGYRKNTTPNIDIFSKESVVFKENISQAPSTEPSHASMFTSLIPSHHGAFISLKQSISTDVKTMAEILHENKYTTASFNGGGQVSSEFGFNRGFDTYVSNTEDTNERFITQVNQSIAWLDKNNADKFFLFLHTYEPHAPYIPIPENLALFETDYAGKLPINISQSHLELINTKKLMIDQADKEHIINAYDAEVRSADDSFGKLIEYLKKIGKYNNTMIIFTSDHGEEFGEHGMMGLHSHELFDEQLKVPLIIKFPNSSVESKIINVQTRNIDILPTVLEVLNIPALDCFEGENLLNILQGRGGALFAISEQDTADTRPPSSIRTLEWKLNKGKLYNLINDPLETKDVSKENTEIMAGLQSQLDKTITNKENKQSKAKIDKKTIKQLKGLGYLK